MSGFMVHWSSQVGCASWRVGGFIGTRTAWGSCNGWLHTKFGSNAVGMWQQSNLASISKPQDGPVQTFHLAAVHWLFMFEHGLCVVLCCAVLCCVSDLIQELPVQQVADRYKVSRGQIQGLQEKAGG